MQTWAHGDMPTWNTYIMLASSDIHNFPEGEVLFQKHMTYSAKVDWNILLQIVTNGYNLDL